MTNIDMLSKTNIEFIREALSMELPSEGFDLELAQKAIEMYRKVLLLAVVELKHLEPSVHLRARIRNAIKEELVETSIKYPNGWHEGWLVPHSDKRADALLDEVTSNVIDKIYTR